jgi:anti-sigma B factor antagonist
VSREHPAFALTRMPDGDRERVLTLTLLRSGPMTEVVLRGVVDLSSARLLTDLIDRVVVQYAPLWLVLDLARVRLLSAAGITALLHARDAVTAQDGRLILRNPSPMTCRVLDITDTARHFDVRTSTMRPETAAGSDLEIAVDQRAAGSSG